MSNKVYIYIRILAAITAVSCAVVLAVCKSTARSTQRSLPMTIDLCNTGKLDRASSSNATPVRIKTAEAYVDMLCDSVATLVVNGYEVMVIHTEPLDEKTVKKMISNITRTFNLSARNIITSVPSIRVQQVLSERICRRTLTIECVNSFDTSRPYCLVIQIE